MQPKGLVGILSGQLAFGGYIALALFAAAFVLQLEIPARGGSPILPTKPEREAKEAVQKAIVEEEKAKAMAGASKTKFQYTQLLRSWFPGPQEFFRLTQPVPVKAAPFTTPFFTTQWPSI
uniref:hypothetical protein n=1 Tax=Candidatus Fimivicinus sp. TaxID=3056640 RepID=UPI003FF117BD